MFVGREKELESLRSLLAKHTGSLAPVVRGNGFFDALISADDLFRA